MKKILIIGAAIALLGAGCATSSKTPPVQDKKTSRSQAEQAKKIAEERYGTKNFDYCAEFTKNGKMIFDEAAVRTAFPKMTEWKRTGPANEQPTYGGLSGCSLRWEGRTLSSYEGSVLFNIVISDLTNWEAVGKKDKDNESISSFGDGDGWLRHEKSAYSSRASILFKNGRTTVSIDCFSAYNDACAKDNFVTIAHAIASQLKI